MVAVFATLLCFLPAAGGLAVAADPTQANPGNAMTTSQYGIIRVTYVSSSTQCRGEAYSSLLRMTSPVASDLFVFPSFATRPYVDLGPFPAGTPIVLAIDVNPFCPEGGTRNSTDPRYAQVYLRQPDAWEVSWEDSDEYPDFDDLVIRVDIVPWVPTPAAFPPPAPLYFNPYSPVVPLPAPPPGVYIPPRPVVNYAPQPDPNAGYAVPEDPAPFNPYSLSPW
jgi:hypothetical protein